MHFGRQNSLEENYEATIAEEQNWAVEQLDNKRDNQEKNPNWQCRLLF